MASARRIPEATVARLPLYLRALGELVRERVDTVASDALALRAGVHAAQVRKDLSHLGSYGTRGVGYDVAYLFRQISAALGLNEDRRVAIVGVGNLGRALVRYGGFPARGFQIVAAFDADPAKVGEELGSVVIRSVRDLESAVRQEKVSIAIITTPASAAQAVAEALVAAGVGSILNFAPTTVSVPPHVTLRQVDLGIELQILSFYEREAGVARVPAGKVPAATAGRRARARAGAARPARPAGVGTAGEAPVVGIADGAAARRPTRRAAGA